MNIEKVYSEEHGDRSRRCEFYKTMHTATTDCYSLLSHKATARGSDYPTFLENYNASVFDPYHLTMDVLSDVATTSCLTSWADTNGLWTLVEVIVAYFKFRSEKHRDLFRSSTRPCSGEQWHEGAWNKVTIQRIWRNKKHKQNFCGMTSWEMDNLRTKNTVTCRMVSVTRMKGSSADDWIY